MKALAGVFIGIVVMACSSVLTQAQNVYISIPAENIFNRNEYNIVENILNTRDHINWRIRIANTPWWPTIRSTSGNYFIHTTLFDKSLPTEVLHWRLASIGGQIPPFRGGDDWPGFKWFNTEDQYWYQPATTTGGYTPGNVAFTFKVPSGMISRNAFHAGEYSIDVTHNYGSSGWFVREFTPDNLKVFLAIPAAISWRSYTPTKYIKISSLDNYRSNSAHILGDLGSAEIGHTVDFNLWSKTSSASIDFTSSKGVMGRRNISMIRLGSGRPQFKTEPLSSTWEMYTSSVVEVKRGNRTDFNLELSVSAADFRKYFFEAGTYTFQMNLEAKSTDNTVSALQNTDVTIDVPPLSEIVIPASGQAVNFNFNTEAHYRQGQSKIIPNQIKLSNNENFELYVKSGTAFFKKSGVQSDIDSDILKIGVDGTPLQIPLSITPQKIILNGTPVLDQKFDIKYTITANSAHELVSKEKTTYSIDVIYSFTAL